MSEISNPESLRTVLSGNLSIPNYQRPYKWKVKNVLDLISDIEHERQLCKANNYENYRYRIGSIILHSDNGKENVVDGQQRLLSICLILIVTNDPDKNNQMPLFHTEFTNSITLDNLQYNLHHIEKYFKNWGTSDKQHFADFLLDGCEMIIIKASNIAEAFQLFDSQNTRGKKLEPADLLKAYHLRSIDDEHEKKMCVHRWENAIDKKILHHVLSKILYRCRCWMRHEYDKYVFSNDVIDEFKGIDINIFNSKNKILPYMQRLYVMSQISAYSINEPIVNGKRFFDYVEHYVSIYDKLFPAIGDRTIKKSTQKLDTDNAFQDLARSMCYYSPKMYRTGDTRLRNALYCLLISYYDKFGENEYEEFFKIAYLYVYQIRLELSQIRMESIRDYILKGLIPSDKGKCGNQTNPFEWIGKSYQAFPSELRILLRMPETEIATSILNQKVRN